MKQIIIGILSILIMSFQLSAQTGDTVSSQRQNQINKILHCIRNDNIIQLSELIQYPVKRPNPIPDINSKESFILYYPTLFDNDFKQKLLNTEYSVENIIDRYDGFGLLNGDIWLNESGKIITINYSSDQELNLQETLTNEIKAMIHSSVKEWNKNILVGESDKYLIRIDLLANKTYRYTSWSKPKTLSDKPDLILFNGTQEFHGTKGGLSYIFKNSGCTYLIDRVNICNTKNDCGLFLKLLLNNQEKNIIKLKEIK